MGKPFKSELQELSNTFYSAVNSDVSVFSESIIHQNSKPLFIVGSGGSFSACHLVELLQGTNGLIGKAVTPLEFFHTQKLYSDANVLIITASGRNKDILISFQQGLLNEPDQILCLCTTPNSPLKKLSDQYSISQSFAFPFPAKKDGFLATNSLLTFFVILARAYGYKLDEPMFKFDLAFAEEKLYINFLKNINLLHATFIVLYSGWSKPVAVDLESKFTEAALANTLLTDYRNFAHGRHHWFDKRKDNSAIIALITPEDKELAEKTLLLMPKSVPVLKIYTEYSQASASIDLLMKSFFLVELIGRVQK